MTAIEQKDTELWERILGVIQEKKRPLWAIMKQCRFLGYADGELVVECQKKHTLFQRIIGQEKERRFVELHASLLTKANVRLKVVVSEDVWETEQYTEGPVNSTFARQRTAPPPNVPPEVQKIADMFEGHIIKIAK